MSLYKERRFTKLGYSAASILHALPLLQMLLVETPKSNLLVEACRLYLECEFFLTELKVLSYFTFKVTLLFLNFVEKNNQEKLLVMLPKLHEDLKNLNLDTLREFIVKYRHVDVPELRSQLEQEIINQMCVKAADGIQLQCGREYGFAKPDQTPRATDLNILSPAELQGLPTNNLDAERDRAKFSNLAQVAKFRNKNFQAKGIRTDMVLYKSNQGVVDSIIKSINKTLVTRESHWTQIQKSLQQKRIVEKLSKAKKETDYTTKLLQICKTWGGPCTTCDELGTVLKSKHEICEKVVKTELSYYRNTHKIDVIARPDLFKIVHVTHEERLENLFILLSDNSQVATAYSSSAIDLPCDLDALHAIKSEGQANVVQEGNIIKPNGICAIIWNINKQPKWLFINLK